MPKARDPELSLARGMMPRRVDSSRTEEMLGFSFRTTISIDRKVTSVASGLLEMQQKIAS